MDHAVVAEVNPHGRDKRQVRKDQALWRSLGATSLPISNCSRAVLGSDTSSSRENFLDKAGAVDATSAGTAEAIAGPKKTVCGTLEHLDVIGVKRQVLGQVYWLVGIGVGKIRKACS
jgi:hypothetical protein